MKMVKIEYYAEAHISCPGEIFIDKDYSEEEIIQKIVDDLIELGRLNIEYVETLSDEEVD